MEEKPKIRFMSHSCDLVRLTKSLNTRKGRNKCGVSMRRNTSELHEWRNINRCGISCLSFESCARNSAAFPINFSLFICEEVFSSHCQHNGSATATATTVFVVFANSFVIYFLTFVADRHTFVLLL